MGSLGLRGHLQGIDHILNIYIANGQFTGASLDILPAEALESELGPACTRSASAWKLGEEARPISERLRRGGRLLDFLAGTPGAAACLAAVGEVCWS